jgi:hypothetical protein
MIFTHLEINNRSLVQFGKCKSGILFTFPCPIETIKIKTFKAIILLIASYESWSLTLWKVEMYQDEVLGRGEVRAEWRKLHSEGLLFAKLFS